MKIGQWLASRPDLLGTEISKIMKKLNTKAPSHSISYTISVLNDELSKFYECNFSQNKNEHFNNVIPKNKPNINKNSLFSKINLDKIINTFIIPNKIQKLKLLSHKPIGSGCIAQVYKASLNDVDVAIKILHPNIENLIKEDIGKLTRIMNLLRISNDFIHQFIIDTKDQTDLRNEAKNLEILKQNFYGNKHIKVPNVYYSSKNILIEEFLDTSTEIKSLSKSKRNMLAFIGLNAACKMIFKDRFFHADLHPGNIFVSDDGKSPKIILLDAGICRPMMYKEYKNLLDLLYETLFSRNFSKAASLILERKEQVNIIKRQEFIDNFNELITKPSKNNRKLVESIFLLLRKHNVQLEYGYSSLITTLTCFDGFMKKLSKQPYNDFYKVFWINAPYKYFVDRFAEKIKNMI